MKEHRPSQDNLTGRSSGDSDPSDDPYQAPQDEAAAAELSLLLRVLAVVIGVIVAVSSVATLVAFLFGLVVAFGGQNQPGAVDPWRTIADGGGRWLFWGGLSLTLVVSLFLGFFAWRKILTVWQRQQMHTLRRRELLDAVGKYREARRDLPDSDAAAGRNHK